MSKKRPRTVDLLPDDEDFEYTRDKMQGPPELQATPVTKPPKANLDYSKPQAYIEGSVVILANCQTRGTVVNCVGNDLHVLDSKGLIHVVKARDVYPDQPS